MADIRYQFVSTGANAVLRDWQSLTSAAQKYAAEINKLHKAEGAVLYGGGGGGGGAGAPYTRRGGGGADGARAARDAERRRAYLAKIRDKHFADEQRSEERAANRSAKVAEQAAAKKVKAEEQALRKVERLHAASEAKERRAAERNQTYLSKLRDRHFADEQRADQRRQALAERSRLAEMKKSAAERAWMRPEGFAGSIFRGIGGAAMGLGAAGIGIATQATRDAMRTQELANRISINARKSGEEFIDPTTLRKEFERTAIATPGIKAEEIGDAVQGFIQLTGDIKTARTGARTFATVASATGSNVGDIARAAASLKEHFNVSSEADMKDVLATLVFQGKEGAFELSDAASMYQRLASSAASFGVPKTAQGVKTLGGLTQIARSGTGSSEQATTAVENLFSQFKAKSALIKSKHKVDVFKDGNVRPIEDLIVETISKVGGTDIAKKQAGLQQIFGEQGIRAINPLVSEYNDVFSNTKGSKEDRVKAASEAVAKKLYDAANAAGTWADVERDAVQAQTNTSAKMTAAWEKVVAMAGEQIVPALLPMVDELTKWTGAIAPATEAVGFFVGAMRNALELLGFIGPKTPEEKLAEKKKQLEAMDADMKANPLPFGSTASQYRAQDEKRKKLVEDIAKETAATTLTSGEATKKFRSFDDFANTLKSSGGIEGPVKDEDLQRLYDQAAFGSPEQTQQLLSADAFPFLTNKGQTQAGLLVNQVQDAKAGKGEMPAGFYEAEKLAPAFSGLGDAVEALQKKMAAAAEAATAASQANLLGGSPG